jgi:large subunit ribosomal protein L20
MTRVKRGFVARRRRNKVLKLAKGFRGSHSVLFRTAQQRTLKALSLAYFDRREEKRNFRSLWIRRVNSFVRDTALTGAHEVSSGPHSSGSTGGESVKAKLSYSRFMFSLKKSQVALNRKVLAQLAIYDPISMKTIIQESTASANAAGK